MKLTRWRVAIAIVALTMVGASAAVATDVFDDVNDTDWYSEPTEWAANNGITNGCGGGNFCPGASVTRAENITFAYRYDQFIAQPALADLQDQIDALQAELDAAEADLATAEDAIEDNVTDISNLPNVYYIEVAADGTKEGGSFGTSVNRTATGVYEVEFPVDDTAECTWSGTIAQKRSSIVDLADTDEGQISLQTDFDTVIVPVRDIDSILVETYDSSGTDADRPFHLQITCGLPTLIFVPPIDPGIIITLGG